MKRFNRFTMVLIFLLIVAVPGVYLWGGSLSFSGKEAQNNVMNNPYHPYEIDVSGKINAPELEGGHGWLNVDKPVRLHDLRGKVILFDFWTYCCINCMHVIPDLEKLEQKYAKELVVIGVHSAKFLNEKETDNIRQAILRYEITHPVVNDSDFNLWKEYGAHGWPHLVIIDPEGKVVGSVSGEGNYELLDEIISRLLEKFKGSINTHPLALALEKDKFPPSQLSFPGKILADGKSHRLFISDSSHNRIVITDLSGKVLQVAGSGAIGLRDGVFAEAEFHHPQGMALVGDSLYIADTENHALRRLDLRQKKVETVAGTGTQSHERSGGAALKTSLNSPWDLAQRQGDSAIYIAMAGPHQLWVYHPDSRTVQPFAGTGREDIIDGPLTGCALAQPSGLTTDGTHLFFADSEVSALRWVDLSDKHGQVKTYIGKGLFVFGDQDGDFSTARLQHPLGVAYHDGKIYLADTYNHKIKVADPAQREITTFAGNGKPGLGDSDAPQFYEPSGLSIAGETLYVADTNNHAIRLVNLKTRRCATLMLDFSEWEKANAVNRFDLLEPFTRLDSKNAPLSTQGTVRVELHLPTGYHLNPQVSPIGQFRVTEPNEKQWVGEKFAIQTDNNTLQFTVNTGSIVAPQSLEAAITYYYCRTDNQGECRIGSLLLAGPLAPGNENIKLQHTVK